MAAEVLRKKAMKAVDTQQQIRSTWHDMRNAVNMLQAVIYGFWISLGKGTTIHA